jgi:hypothetical protein
MRPGALKGHRGLPPHSPTEREGAMLFRTLAIPKRSDITLFKKVE